MVLALFGAIAVVTAGTASICRVYLKRFLLQLLGAGVEGGIADLHYGSHRRLCAAVDFIPAHHHQLLTQRQLLPPHFICCNTSLYLDDGQLYFDCWRSYWQFSSISDLFLLLIKRIRCGTYEEPFKSGQAKESVKPPSVLAQNPLCSTLEQREFLSVRKSTARGSPR